MIKIIDECKVIKFTTTFNDIPIGQVFRGTVLYKRAGPTSGVFYKAEGRWNNDKNGTADCLVVKLDGSTPGWGNVSINCLTVENYEPLDVELIIKG